MIRSQTHYTRFAKKEALRYVHNVQNSFKIQEEICDLSQSGICTYIMNFKIVFTCLIRDEIHTTMSTELQDKTMSFRNQEH